MNHHVVRCARLVALALSSLVILDAEAGGFGSAPGQQVDAAQQARFQHIEALRTTKGLHAAALASEGRRYVGFEMIEVELIAANLEAVAAQADVVIRGTIGVNRTRLAMDGRGKETVVLDYGVQVDQVLKGPPSLVSDGIVWTVPGGVYQFQDGSMVEILTPSFRKPQPGEEYVLFLQRDSVFGHYRLAFGTQALFRLHSDGSVEAGAARDYPTGTGLLEEGRQAFIDSVCRAVKGQE